jgi:hypothetical protein
MAFSHDGTKSENQNTELPKKQLSGLFFEQDFGFSKRSIANSECLGFLSWLSSYYFDNTQFIFPVQSALGKA